MKINALFPMRVNVLGRNIKQLLHTPPLNTMNYLHEVVDISRGRCHMDDSYSYPERTHSITGLLD